MAKHSKLFRHIDGKSGRFFNNSYKTKREDKPQEGKQYLLIGGADKPSIVKGNSWEESEVKQ